MGFADDFVYFEEDGPRPLQEQTEDVPDFSLEGDSDLAEAEEELLTDSPTLSAQPLSRSPWLDRAGLLIWVVAGMLVVLVGMMQLA